VRVPLFVTCIGEAVLPEIGRATVELLERLGHEVVFPKGQTCCGQMHLNSGHRNDALELARRFVRVFDGFEVIVASSSSCVGAVRELYPELARESEDETLERDVRALAPRVFELSELLANRLGLTDAPATHGTESCHVNRSLSLRRLPSCHVGGAVAPTRLRGRADGHLRVR
jgi:L-lactate dehydrogenase complex protein LldE